MQNRNSNISRRLAVLITFALSVMLLPTACTQKTNNFNIAASQSRLNFELHNETGYEIIEVYVSPNTTEDWQEDILGQDTLPNKQSVNIKFSRSKQDYWDLKVVFKGGKESVWYKFDLSQITDITISFRNGKAYSTTKNGG